jgi:LmbE family N-acetylglucosaminyl deacetylase
VVAHPDDEAWLAGGLIAWWTRQGAAVTVLCVTDGEAGVDRTGQAEGPATVRALRAAELAASCAVLGAGLRRLGLPDGGLDPFPVDRAEAMITEQIAALAPDCVVTHGPDGDYGHLDHLAVHRWVRAAHRAAAPGAWDVLVPALAPGRMHPLWRRFRRAGFGGVRTGMAPGDFGAEAGLVLALDPALAARKERALRCHASQLRDGDLDSFLGPGLVADLLVEERFVRAEVWR